MKEKERRKKEKKQAGTRRETVKAREVAVGWVSPVGVWGGGSDRRDGDCKKDVVARCVDIARKRKIEQKKRRKVGEWSSRRRRELNWNVQRGGCENEATFRGREMGGQEK